MKRCRKKPRKTSCGTDARTHTHTDTRMDRLITIGHPPYGGALIKHSTKFPVSTISHLRWEESKSYFTTSTPLGSTRILRKIIGSSSSNNMHIYYWLWSIVQSFKSLISHLRGEVSTSYFTSSTPLGSTITQRIIIGSSCPDNMEIY
jgi:hypothetical protein